MRIAVDTNVLAYAAGLDDIVKVDQALDVLGRSYVGHDLVFPAQVLAELFHVLMRKGRFSAREARASILDWQREGRVVPTAESTLETAFGLVTDHGLQSFDAIILAAASEAGCSLLLSEDFQDGFAWGGVTVANPFAAEPHPLLVSL